ncbi:hypothetical protein F5882DRAFT_385116 [Hyaloscypha sp. PMI_1271]|nr:hypothetical protein F5882DRAFT_385116 [Hyaloscypha sp. PMI_1271]
MDLLHTIPDDTLQQKLQRECEHMDVNIHQIISQARHHTVPIYQPPTQDSAPISPPNSLPSAGLDLPIPRAPTRTSLSGQSGTSSHRETGPSPEIITAVVARLGVLKEHTLTMKRSRISSDFSFITKKKVAQLKLSTTACNITLPTRSPAAHGYDTRVTQMCQLTWLRSTSDKTHDTTCLIVPSSYIEADFELGHKDYGYCALEDDAPDDSPVEAEDAGMRFHSSQNKFHEINEPSFHRSATSTSDNQTVKQSATIPTHNQGQGRRPGEGHAQNLVDGLIRGQSIRKGSPTPSQIPRPSASPNRTTGSPTPSQPRAQATPAPSTSSKLSQSSQLLAVEYKWDVGDVSTSGALDLNATGPAFLEFLKEKCEDDLGMDLDREHHRVQFMPDIDKSKRRIFNLHNDLVLQQEWVAAVEWIKKNHSSNTTQLYVVIVEKRPGGRTRVT